MQSAACFTTQYNYQIIGNPDDDNFQGIPIERRVNSLQSIK